jgi:anthranilate synthase component 2
VRVALVDSQDSFSRNVAHALGVLGADVAVLQSPVDDVPTCDLVVIGPGPGRPEDHGVVALAARLLGRRPVLGICLGHQALVLACGGRLDRAEPVHGHATAVRHRGAGLFRGLPDPVAFGRYHSLVATPATDGPLEVDAWTEDGLVMAVRHRTLPAWGVQFHPESVLSGRYGLRLLRAALRAATAAI